jgi:hypothetical protein
MTSPIFQFFEAIADELCSDPNRVLTGADFQVSSEQAPLIEELRAETRTATPEQAMQSAVKLLEEHFRTKGSRLPFTYDPQTGQFAARDIQYLCFIKQMSDIRSIPKRSRDFELGVLDKLTARVTGALHRVGHPRDKLRLRHEFNAHLKKIGFKRNVLLGKEKDGGFDILWVLPIGSKPHQPIVSVQCKNGAFKLADADVSVGSGKRSFGEHGGLQADVHVPCVLFNDYLYPEVTPAKAMNFVPLGLTDLSPLETAISSEAI